MKIYSKVVGVFLTLSGLIALSYTLYWLFKVNSFEDQALMGIICIPCILLLHFLSLHNFGFNLKSDIPKSNYKYILIFTLFSLIFSITIPTGYFLYKIKSEQKLEETYSKLIDRGMDNIESVNLQASLKTKYEDGRLYYIFSVLKPDKSQINSKYHSFSFELKDEDGFKIQTIETDEIVNLIKADVPYGIISNSQTYMSREDYSKISEWDLMYKSN